MTTPEPSPTLAQIPPDECWQLIGQHSVGRFAVARADEPPLVVPVNYVVDEECIIFRTDVGLKLTLLPGAASLQIDCIDPFHHVGWSVLVQGWAAAVSRSDVAQIDLVSWIGDRAQWVRLRPAAVTGRRIVLAEAPRDPRGYL